MASRSGTARSPSAFPIPRVAQAAGGADADEVVRFLEAVASLKTRTALTTAYAAGLRASEAVGLKLGDVDCGRMVIRVEHGKGGKDRYVHAVGAASATSALLPADGRTGSESCRSK